MIQQTMLLKSSIKKAEKIMAKMKDKKSVIDAIAAMKVQVTYPENLWK